MKAKIRNFLRLRKQRDSVKILCILALAALVFFIRTVYYAGEMYCYVNAPVEYVLTGEEGMSQSHVDALYQCDGVIRVSCQKEIPITLKYRGAEAVINCTMLPQEYLDAVIDTKLPYGTKRIYMNRTAFSLLQQELSEQKGSLEDMGEKETMVSGTEWNIRYAMEEISPEGDSSAAVPVQKDKAAKLVVTDLLQRGETEEGFVCMAEADHRLIKEASGLRVQFEKHDLDGLHVNKLRTMGYTIENEEEIITEEYEIRLKLLHIWYGVFSGGICLVAVFTLWRVVRNTNRH